MKAKPRKCNCHYCNCCYIDNIKTCDGCGMILELNIPVWCASDGKHFCNEDCQPDLNEALIIGEKVQMVIRK